MKKLLLFFISIAIIFSFCSCAGSKKNIPDVTDTQENCNGFAKTGRICESKDSFYLLRNSYIYVVDKKSHKCRPLCNKPDCLHDKYTGGYNTNKCNAFLLSDLDEIDYYDGKLYFTTTRDEKDKDGNTVTYNMITRMNADGTGREDIYETTDKYFNSIKVHRGYIYSHIESLKQENGSWELNGMENSKLCRMSVDGGEWEQLEITNPKSEFVILDYRIYYDKIFEVFMIPNESSNKILCYDIDKKSTAYIDEKLSTKPEWLFTVMDEKMYYDSNNIVYRADMEGNNEKKLVDLGAKIKGYSKFRVFNNDGKFIYVMAYKDEDSVEDSLLVLIDKKGKLKKYKLPKGIVLQSAGDVDGQVYIKPEENSDCFYFLDKTKLGTKDFMTKIYEQKLG